MCIGETVIRAKWILGSRFLSDPADDYAWLIRTPPFDKKPTTVPGFILR